MNFVRSALLICATLLLSITVYTLYNYYQNRYVIVAQESGLYVFDRKDSQVHFCDQNNCKAVMPQYTLQAMIQAMPQSGLGGDNKAITLPQSLHSALGNQGNPMALAQALLAQGNKAPDAAKAADKPESAAKNEEFDDIGAFDKSLDEDNDFGSAEGGFEQQEATELGFDDADEEDNDFGDASSDFGSNDFGDPSGGFGDDADDDAFVAGADF